MLLPTELIDHIFSFLRGDISALEACSEAHPLFSRLAERHLWAHLIVGTSGVPVPDPYKQLSSNSLFLNYALTLQIHGTFGMVLSIMSMIPRMANLVSLALVGRSYLASFSDFVSELGSCLQQSAIEELSLYSFYYFPLSVLNSGKNIKKLTLSHCLVLEEPMSSLRWASRLTSLELGIPDDDHDFTGYPELLTACSNSLRTLHLDVGYSRRSTYVCTTSHDVGGYWINNHREFPCTLSALICLKELSISVWINSYRETKNEIGCPLPAIMRLMETVPPIQVLTLNFYCSVWDITFLARTDWSLLGRLRTPCDLHISGEGTDLFTPESILDALAGNESLMDLVKRGVISLKPGRNQYV